MTMKTTSTAEGRYARRIDEARGLIEDLATMLDDLPAPSDSTDWGHVGTAGELVRQLEDAIETLKGMR
jgi:hypothetical protein